MKVLLAFSLLLLATACDQSPVALPTLDDWAAVSEAEPSSVSDLSLWLSADSIQGLKDGAHMRFWSDRAGKVKALESSDSNGPTFRATAANGKPAVSFDGITYFEKFGVSGEALVAPTQATVILVFKETDKKLHDFFGWGNCEKNRFLAHDLYGRGIQFQAGSPELGKVNGDFGEGWHVAAFVRGGSSAEVIIDGKILSKKDQFGAGLDLGDPQPLIVGNSPCDNRLVGMIAELAIFKRTLTSKELGSVLKRVAANYRVTLLKSPNASK